MPCSVWGHIKLQGGVLMQVGSTRGCRYLWTSNNALGINGKINELVLKWMVYVSVSTLNYAIRKTLDCLQYLLCKWMKSYVQVGWKWIIHNEHLWGLNYAHFKKSTVFDSTFLYTHEEQSHGLYKKPTNYHMNVQAFFHVKPQRWLCTCLKLV